MKLANREMQYLSTAGVASQPENTMALWPVITIGQKLRKSTEKHYACNLHQLAATI